MWAEMVCGLDKLDGAPTLFKTPDVAALFETIQQASDAGIGCEAQVPAQLAISRRYAVHLEMGLNEEQRDTLVWRHADLHAVPRAW